MALVIPAWHEEAALGAVLSEIPAGTIDAVFVVLASDEDATEAIAHGAGATVLRQSRPGYGAACWEGALAALEQGADVIAFMDGDYSDPPAFLPLLLNPIHRGDTDLVLGCRDFSQFPLALPAHARLGNAAVLAAVSMMLRRRIRDFPSMKVIQAQKLQQLALREMTYGFTVEMIVKSVRAGLRIAQLQVAYRLRLGGRSKISGSLGGTVGAAWKLCTCPVRYSLWRPAPPAMSRPEATA